MLSAAPREDRMKRTISVIVLALLPTAFASMPAAAKDCPGLFIRDSQNYDNRGHPDEIERVDGVIPKGTRDTIVGFMIVGGKKYYVQIRAFLHEPADIRIQPGCKLEKYPP
jgi:hypothetical protein